MSDPKRIVVKIETSDGEPIRTISAQVPGPILNIDFADHAQRVVDEIDAGLEWREDRA